MKPPLPDYYDSDDLVVTLNHATRRDLQLITSEGSQLSVNESDAPPPLLDCLRKYAKRAWSAVEADRMLNSSKKYNPHSTGLGTSL